VSTLRKSHFISEPTRKALGQYYVTLERYLRHVQALYYWRGGIAVRRSAVNIATPTRSTHLSLKSDPWRSTGLYLPLLFHTANQHNLYYRFLASFAKI